MGKKLEEDPQKLRGLLLHIFTMLNRKLASRKIISQLPDDVKEKYNINAKIDTTAGIFSFGTIFNLMDENEVTDEETFDEETKIKFKIVEKQIEKLLDRFQQNISLFTLTRLTEFSVGFSTGNIPLIGNLVDMSIAIVTAPK